MTAHCNDDKSKQNAYTVRVHVYKMFNTQFDTNVERLTIVLTHPLPDSYLLLAVSKRTVTRPATTLMIHKVPANSKVVEITWDRWWQVGK